MPRSVNKVASRNRKKRILKLTKGYFGRRKNVWTVAKNAHNRALEYRRRDTRAKKRDIKSLWIQRISAGARSLGYSYSKFINLLKKSGTIINRKILSKMAMEEFDNFKNLVNGK